MPALSGLRSGLRAVRALQTPAAGPGRLAEVGAASARAARGERYEWLAEHEAKELLREAGIPVVDGRLAADEDDAALALGELGGPVALKLSAPELRHKSEHGALALDLATERDVRAAHRRLAGANGGGAMLIERMAPPGVELLVAARSDAVVPVLTVALGGVWTELLQDAALIPLPATPARVEEALRSLRGAPLLTGGRGGSPRDIAAAAGLAARVGELLLERGLALVELNPVLVHRSGAVAVDALAARPAG